MATLNRVGVVLTSPKDWDEWIETIKTASIEFAEGCDNTRRAHLRAIKRLEQEFRLLLTGGLHSILISRYPL
jgi:hypothetical protein